jgi:hypothetical protein
MMASKHVTYFLKRYRNLHRYSNQGWEFQNKQVSKHKAILIEETMNTQRNVFNSRNLDIYNMNQIRYIYHHRTQNGGSKGTHGGRSSKIVPLGLWFLRVLCWGTTKEDKGDGMVAELVHFPTSPAPSGSCSKS